MKIQTALKAGALSMAIAASLTAAQAQAADGVLNIYNWSDYIDENDLQRFRDESGLAQVNYDVYDSNEALEGKIMAGNSGYDVVVPTGSFLERQIQAGIYAKLDKSKLKNYGNLDKALLEKVAAHDPGNMYGVPYAWGTIGLGLDVKAVTDRLGADAPLDSYDLIFDAKYAAKLQDCGIAVLDSPAEVMAVALNYLGLNPNSEKKADLDKAEAMLKKVRGNFRYFHSSQYINDLANGEICVAMGYNGDIMQSIDRASEAENGLDLIYSIPKEGTLVWFDLMAIPADAPNKDAAYQFIDFVLTPEVGAGISNYVYYAVPNAAALPLVIDEVKSDPGIYPTDEVKAKLFPQKAHTAKFDRVLTRAWTNVKADR